jgi:hypothetical protein
VVFNATFNNISAISWRTVFWWRKPEETTILPQVTECYVFYKYMYSCWLGHVISLSSMICTIKTRIQSNRLICHTFLGKQFRSHGVLYILHWAQQALFLCKNSNYNSDAVDYVTPFLIEDIKYCSNQFHQWCRKTVWHGETIYPANKKNVISFLFIKYYIRMRQLNNWCWQKNTAVFKLYETKWKMSKRHLS